MNPDENDASLANVGLAIAGVSSEKNKLNTSSGRVATGRVKKPKKVFDPTDDNKELQNTKSKVKPSVFFFDYCVKCHKYEIKCGSGHKSNFLGCNKCKLQWHYACLFTKFENASVARNKFKCSECRTCCICLKARTSETQTDMITCSGCAETYHLECHFPEVMHSMLCDPKWKCQQCDPHYNKSDKICEQGKTPNSVEVPNNNKAKTIRDSSKNRKPSNKAKITKQKKENSSSNVVPGEQLMQRKKKTITKQPNGNDDYMEPCSSTASKPIQSTNNAENEIIHFWRDGLNVRDWSVDEVVKYVSKFYPNEAHVFKQQDVDGAALLLLARKDVLNRFGLKLGRALLIYELVCSLQNKSNDITLAWQN